MAVEAARMPPPDRKRTIPTTAPAAAPANDLINPNIFEKKCNRIGVSSRRSRKEYSPADGTTAMPCGSLSTHTHTAIFESFIGTHLLQDDLQFHLAVSTL